MNRRPSNPTADRPAGRDASASPASAAELLSYLQQLHTLLTQLLELAQRKLTALRAADSDMLDSCAAREQELLEQVFRAAQGRGAALARLAQTLPGVDVRKISLRQLAEHLREPESSALRARSVALERIAHELRKKNETVATVAQRLHGHVRYVLGALMQAGQESVGYGPQGSHQMHTKQQWVDAVG